MPASLLQYVNRYISSSDCIDTVLNYIIRLCNWSLDGETQDIFYRVSSSSNNSVHNDSTSVVCCEKFLLGVALCN